MKKKKKPIQKHGSKPLLSVLLVAIIIGLFLVGIYSIIRNQIHTSREKLKTSNKQLVLIKDIRSQIALLTMWQYTLSSLNPQERNITLKEIRKATGKLDELGDELHKTSVIDTVYTKKLLISLSQLKEANAQIVSAKSTYKPSVQIDSLTIDYRSLFEIASFHINSVEELQIRQQKIFTNKRYQYIVVNTIIGATAVLILFVIYLLMFLARKKAEDSRDEAEGYLHDLFESMPSALIGLNHTGHVVRMNDIASVLATGPLIIEKPNELQTLFPFIKFPNTQLQECITLGEAYTFEFTTNSAQLFRANLFPFHNTQNAGAVLRLEDITIEHALKEELNQTKKMNAIGQLAGGVAHDFNNMLGGIMNATELIKLGCDQEEQNLFLDLIDNTTQRASELTQKLLTFARKSVHKNESIDLHDLLKATSDLLTHTIDKRIDIVLNLHADQSTIMGDKGQVQNIFLNMGINAGQAMPDGGTLVFETTIREYDQLYCDNSSFELDSGLYITVEVTDNGTGITPENMEHIFEPFFTTKGSGTGIGLASSYGTIQIMGGEIEVQSTLNIGTTFKVAIPLKESLNGTTEVKSSPTIHGSGTILVIDDEMIMRKSMALILERLGYSVMLAQNGLEGVEMFRDHQDEIDLIILDMIMPVMKGDQAMVKIREISSHIPVVICSGYSHSEDIQKVEALSIQGIIPKPYQVSDLSKLIAEVLGITTEPATS